VSRAWSCAVATGDGVLLDHPCFVGEPDLYRVETEALVPRDARQFDGEVFRVYDPNKGSNRTYCGASLI
jgi:hypothetical protein